MATMHDVTAAPRVKYYGLGRFGLGRYSDPNPSYHVPIEPPEPVYKARQYWRRRPAVPVFRRSVLPLLPAPGPFTKPKFGQLGRISPWFRAGETFLDLYQFYRSNMPPYSGHYALDQIGFTVCCGGLTRNPQCGGKIGVGLAFTGGTCADPPGQLCGTPLQVPAVEYGQPLPGVYNWVGMGPMSPVGSPSCASRYDITQVWLRPAGPVSGPRAFRPYVRMLPDSSPPVSLAAPEVEYGGASSRPPYKPYHQPARSGGRPVVHELQPAPRYTREIKFSIYGNPLVRGLFAAYGGITETEDVLDAAIKAMPKGTCSLRDTVQGKSKCVYDNIKRINPVQFAANLAVGQLQDRAIGKFGRASKIGVKSATRHGYNMRPVGYGFGPAM